MRAIDADALIEFIENRYDITWKDDYEGGIKDACTDILEKISDMPTIEPEPHWIKCSERLPEDDTLMLVNYIDNRPDAMDIWIGWHEMENVWYIDGEAHSREFGNEVIAWMPLPEPYKEEER